MEFYSESERDTERLGETLVRKMEQGEMPLDEMLSGADAGKKE